MNVPFAMLAGLLLAGVLTGWLWPLVVLGGVVLAGVVTGRPWPVAALVVASGALVSVPDGAVRYVGTLWMWVAALVTATALLGGARRGGPTLLWGLAILLPPGDRADWRGEVRAVLHACGDDRETRRQVLGFLTAMPATVVTSWRVRR